MHVSRRSLLVCAIAASAVTAAPAAAADRQAGDRVVSASGTKQIDGQTAYVEVRVVVPAGQSEAAAKDRALKAQNAKKHVRALGRHRAGLGQRERDAALQPRRPAGLGAERTGGDAVELEQRRLERSVSSTAARRALARRWFPAAREGSSSTGRTASAGRRWTRGRSASPSTTRRSTRPTWASTRATPGTSGARSSRRRLTCRPCCCTRTGMSSGSTTRTTRARSCTRPTSRPTHAGRPGRGG